VPIAFEENRSLGFGELEFRETREVDPGFAVIITPMWYFDRAREGSRPADNIESALSGAASHKGFWTLI
jgi:hypothetical protein